MGKPRGLKQPAPELSLGAASLDKEESAIRNVCVWAHVCKHTPAHVHAQAHVPSKGTAARGQERVWPVPWLERRPVGLEHSVLEWVTELRLESRRRQIMPGLAGLGRENVMMGSGRGVPSRDHTSKRSLCYMKNRFGGTPARHSWVPASLCGHHRGKTRLPGLGIYTCASSVHLCHEAARVRHPALPLTTSMTFSEQVT